MLGCDAKKCSLRVFNKLLFSNEKNKKAIFILSHGQIRNLRESLIGKKFEDLGGNVMGDALSL